MPLLFRPYADTVARSVLVVIVVVPFWALGLAYWVSASQYTTGQSIVVDQPVPFSHQHHVAASVLIAATVARALKHRRSRAFPRRIPA